MTYKDYVPCPTIYEAIEFLDSKGVYVLPCQFRENLKLKWWDYKIERDGFDTIRIGGFATRSAAYSAGLTHALKHKIDSITENK